MTLKLFLIYLCFVLCAGDYARTKAAANPVLWPVLAIAILAVFGP